MIIDLAIDKDALTFDELMLTPDTPVIAWLRERRENEKLMWFEIAVRASERKAA